MSIGPTWTQIPNIPITSHFIDLCYANGVWIAITTDKIFASYDGILWTHQYTQSGLKSICYGSGKFVVIGSTSQICISSNGYAWSKHTAISGTTSWTAVRYGDGRFIALASQRVYHSTDAITWSNVLPYSGQIWTDLCYGDGKYIVVGVSSSNPDVCTSADLINWTAHTCPADKDIVSCCQGYGLFVACAEDSIVTSPDGANWSVAATFPGMEWKYVRFGNGYFVAVGKNGMIITSSDGATWVEVFTTISDDLYACGYGDRKFIAVGDNGVIMTTSFKNDRIGKIKVLSKDLTRTCIIKEVSSAEIVDEINGEYTLSFTAEIDFIRYEYLTQDSVLEIFGTYFDVAYIKKEAREDGTYFVTVESEHVSYRLNDPKYNIGMFGEYGTPVYILSKILEGTEFTTGDAEFTDVTTHAIYEPKSRRGLVMEFIKALGGEATYSGFTIGIAEHRGKSTPTLFRAGKNLSVASVTVDKRQLDKFKRPLVTIACEPLILDDTNYEVGDEILLVDSKLGIGRDTQEQSRNENGELLYWTDDTKTIPTTVETEWRIMQTINLRIVKYTFNPYTEGCSFEISNSTCTLADSLYRIETQAVSKDTKYNGIRIGPQYGFEAVRNDNKARAYFRSDQMAFQVGDGSGDPNMWQDKLFYEVNPETGEAKLVFAGTLSADVVDVLSSLITPNLYAGKAYISELTVDNLETSTKVQKYLATDTSDVNYIRIYAQTIKFITARCSANFSPSYVSDGSISDTGGVAVYYSGVSISETTGEISLIGGTQQAVSARTAYDSGFIYRGIDATNFYKLTSASEGQVYYSIYEIVEADGTSEQARTAKNELLYWVDESHTGSTTDELDSEGEPLEPVMMYVYNELVKQSITFMYDEISGQYLPVTVLGAGSGVTPIAGQGRLLKRTDGVALEYTNRDGDVTGGVYLQDDGFVDITARRAGINVNTTAKTITVAPEGDVNPIVISYTEVGNKLTLTWPDSQSFDVEVN